MLRVGIDVQIKRSDGRVHSASIVKIAGNEVTVEWLEPDNPKSFAKQVTLAELTKLNAHLFIGPSEPTIDEPTIEIERPADRAPRPTTLLPIRSRLQRPVSTLSTNLSPLREKNTTMPVKKDTQVKSKAMPPPKETARKCILPPSKLPEVTPQKIARSSVAPAQPFTNPPPPGKGPNSKFAHMIYEYRSGMQKVAFRGDEPSREHKICVAVRKRPVNRKEANTNDLDVVTVFQKDSLIVHEPKTKLDLTPYLENNQFRFDYTFDETSDNDLVYRYTAKPLVRSIFDGGMATCFAYGQTGSGKTHTMGGTFGKNSQDSTKGIYYLAANDIFNILRQPIYARANLTVLASYFEIYGGKVFDLLDPNKKLLRVLEDGKQQVQVVGLHSEPVTCAEQVLTLINKGNKARTSGQTAANANSSRSHAIFQVSLQQGKRLYGRLSLVDLAGNERGADTGNVSRQVRAEGSDINKSLLALKECIRALGRKGAHLPFRGSKLTLILKDSFVGEKSRTCMIAMISPTASSCEHTMNTLRYADRVKELSTGAADATEDEIMQPAVDNRLRLQSPDEDPDNEELRQAMELLNEAEEEVLVGYDEILLDMDTQMKTLHALREVAAEPEQNHENHINNLENCLQNIQHSLNVMYDKAQNLRLRAQEEEAVARAVAGRR